MESIMGISDTLRQAIEDSGMTRYAIAQATGIRNVQCHTIFILIVIQTATIVRDNFIQ